MPLPALAVIDIGSNTGKYTIFSKEGKPLRARSATLQLLRYLEDGRFSREGIDLLCGALTAFCADIRALCPTAPIAAVATAVFRRLRDPQSAAREVRERTGVSVRVLSGEEEAALSFRGAIASMNPPPREGIVLDMGGGSTEVILFAGETVKLARSLPFGALSLTRDFVCGEFPTAAEAEEIRARAGGAFDEIPAPEVGLPLLPVGGTAKAVAFLNRASASESGARALTLPAFRAQLSAYLAGRDLEEMRARFPDRYRVLLPGMLVYDEAAARFGAASLLVPEGGLREGVAAAVLAGDRSFPIS